MGNCCGGEARPTDKNNVHRYKARREQNWAATGNISLRDGYLKQLPSSVADVGKAARTLDATNNCLTSLPAYIGTLVNLQRLILASNQLTSLSRETSALTNLKVLVLDRNRLTELPEEIGVLQKLERLCASENALTGLPASLSKLSSLTVLRLSNNKLSEVPEPLAACASLEEIDLSDNYLQTLPGSLGGLKRLKVLAADQNRIASVAPALLTGCAALATLTLHENPITVEELQATKGYDLLEQRRRSKFDKQIAHGVLTSGLDEGIDRNVKAPS